MAIGIRRAHYEEGLVLAQEGGASSLVAILRLNLGECARECGDAALAVSMQRAAIRLSWEVGDHFMAVLGLAELAASLAATGLAARAAYFFGAAEAQREAMGVVRPASERQKSEAILTGVRARLGEEASAVAWAEGRTLSLEEAVAEALREDDDG